MVRHLIIPAVIFKNKENETNTVTLSTQETQTQSLTMDVGPIFKSFSRKASFIMHLVNDNIIHMSLRAYEDFSCNSGDEKIDCSLI